MHRLGVQETFCFDDVLDYKEESQYPALALIVIFPESQDDEERKALVEANRMPTTITDNLEFLRQTIDNSCGLIAILHCVLNTIAVTSIRKAQRSVVVSNETDDSLPGHNSILDNAIRSDKGITTFLEESKELEVEYQSAAESGVTGIPEDVKYHYIALVGCQDGNLYELDGERSSPLIKGSSPKTGYILNPPEQMTRITDSFTHGSIDFSLYKLRQSMR